MCKKNRPHPMMSGFGRILVVVSLALGATQDGRAQDKSPAERGQGLAQVSSIGDSLRMAGQHPLHIV
jgi:hypothetical protein